MVMEVGSGRRLYCCMWCYQSFETDPVICYLCRIFSDAVFLYPLCYGLTRSGRLERLAGQETRPDRRRTGRLRLVLFFFDNSNPRTQATFIDYAP